MVPPSGRASRVIGTRVGPADIGVPNRRRNAPDSMNWHEDESLNVTVECAAVARATWRQFSLPAAGRPQLTTMRCCLAEISNDRQPACPSDDTSIGGGTPVSISSTVL